jgi:hypothetical protein
MVDGLLFKYLHFIALMIILGYRPNGGHEIRVIKNNKIYTFRDARVSGKAKTKN